MKWVRALTIAVWQKLDALQLRSKILLGFFAVLTIFTCTELAVYIALRASQQREQASASSNRVINVSDALLLQLVNMQTSQRGYLLIGDPEVLDLYTQGMRESQRLQAELISLVADDQHQLTRALAIRDGVERWQINVITPTFELRAQVSAGEHSFSDLTAFLQASVNRGYFVAIRDQVAELRAAELVRLQQNTAAQQRATSLLTILLLSAPLAAIILALLIAVLLARNIGGRIAQLMQLTTQLAASPPAVLPLDGTKDEVSQLTSVFVQMANTIRQQHVSRELLLASLQENEERFRQLAENIDQVFWLIDSTSGQFIYISPAYERLWGRTCQSLYADPAAFVAAIHPDDRACVQAAEAGKLADTYQETYRIVRPDGSIRWVRSRAFPISDAGGVVYRIAGISEDVTEQRQAEVHLAHINQELNTQVQAMEQHTHELRLISELSDLVQTSMSSVEAYAIIGASLHQLFPATDGALAIFKSSQKTLEVVAMWGKPLSSAVFGRDECWALRRGQIHHSHDADSILYCAHIRPPYPVSVLCAPLVARGALLGVLQVHQLAPAVNIEQRINLLQMVADTLELAIANLHLQDSLRQQSIRDPLTGLFNRRYLEETLERELRRVQRSQGTLSVLMLDVDYFKRFNDTYGHGAGDMVLHELGGILQQTIRESDIACRFGGEEFTIVLPDVDMDTAALRAEAIRMAVKRLQIVYQGQTLPSVSISLGIACYPIHAASVAELLLRADQALYSSKQHGRDRYTIAELPPA